MLIMIATRAAGIQKSAQSYKDEKERMQERRLSNENLLDTLDDLGLDNEEEEIVEGRLKSGSSSTKHSRNTSIVSNHSAKSGSQDILSNPSQLSDLGDGNNNESGDGSKEEASTYILLRMAHDLAYGEYAGNFNNFMLVWIICATIMVGLQTYSSLETNQFLLILDLIVLVFFTFEVVVKFFGLSPSCNVAAMLKGFFLGSEKWWNIFDLAVVIMSMPGVIPASAGSSIYILRLARLARIAKLLNKIPQLRMIITGLIAGLKAIGYIMILLALVFYIYAIAGIIFFKENDPLRFRNIQITMITLFQLSTFDDWPVVLFTNYYGCDEYGGEYLTYNDVGNNATEWAAVLDMYKCSSPSTSKYIAPIYFVSFIMVSIILVSLFIGTITMSMSQSTAEMKIEQEEEDRKDKIKKAAQDVKAQLKKKKKSSSDDNEKQGLLESCMTRKDRIYKRRQDKLRTLLSSAWGVKVDIQETQESKGIAASYENFAAFIRNLIGTSAFNNFMTLVIILAGVQAGIEADYVSLVDSGVKNESDSIDQFLAISNIVVLTFFTMEVVLKFISYDFTPLEYFTSGWNIFDFIIVLGSFLMADGSLIMILRLLRLFRMLKLVKSLPQLAVIVSALLKGFQSIGFIGVLLFLVYYVFAIIGTMFFSANLPMYFVDLHTSMLSLFRHSTLEGWSADMYQNFYGCDAYGDCDGMHASEVVLVGESAVFSWFAAIYNILFVVLGSWVMLTLFIGVVTASMEEAQAEDKVKKKIQQNLRRYQKEQNIPDHIIHMYREAFTMLDLDDSGLIQVDELKIGFLSLGIKISNAEVMEYMKQIDDDSDGTIDRCEFVIFMNLLRSDSLSNKDFKFKQATDEVEGPGVEMKSLTKQNSNKIVPIG